MGLKNLFFTLVITFFFNIKVNAEYRAFVLLKKNKSQSTHQQILTTLDPDQYQTQYPLNKDESLTYVDTWRCPGNTSQFQAICTKPQAKSRKPSSSESPEINKNK